MDPPDGRIPPTTAEARARILPELSRKVQHFNYARLEEATFYQYAYGESSNLIPQACVYS